MSASAIVTRGFLFSTALIVTAGYNAGAVAEVIVTPPTVVHDPLRLRDVPASETFIWQGPKKKCATFRYSASGAARWARVSAECRFNSRAAEDEEALLALLQ